MVFSVYFYEQQAETQIKRRMGIGSHMSERRLIDELTRMGMNESIVRTIGKYKFFVIDSFTFETCFIIW